MGRGRVLVVDDEPGILRAMDRILSPHYDVQVAGTPGRGLEMAAAEPPDLAVLDIRMPEMDGFALMARLLERDPHMDAILMTGSADERDARMVRAIRERAFFFLTKPFDREVLLTLVERCMELRRLNAENRAHLTRMEREIEAARVFQQSLLPEPRAARDGLRVAVHYEPGDELGGDFCDYLFGDFGLGLVVVDVSGHGATAAMQTGMVKLAFRDAVGEGLEPAAVARRIARTCRLFPQGRHLSAVCVRAHGDRIEIVNAGHPDVFRIGRDGVVERLASTAPIVHPGLTPWRYDARVVALTPGDLLLVYTDGLIEARSAAGLEYGIDRLEASIRTWHGRTGSNRECATLLSSLREDLASYTAGRPLDDDLTLAVVERR
jgi:serine phosphatase RsbU (regulator of sigma subunit)